MWIPPLADLPAKQDVDHHHVEGAPPGPLPVTSRLSREVLLRPIFDERLLDLENLRVPVLVRNGGQGTLGSDSVDPGVLETPRSGSLATDQDPRAIGVVFWDHWHVRVGATIRPVALTDLLEEL